MFNFFQRGTKAVRNTVVVYNNNACYGDYGVLSVENRSILTRIKRRHIARLKTRQLNTCSIQK